jgi:uncharacterized iron-regulated protein
LFNSLAIWLVLTSLLAGCANSGRALEPAVFSNADIVILGEVHDNPEHHRRQAELIAALSPSAVAFEMLSAEQAAIANGTSARDSRLAEAIDWADSGWPEWRLYQPVFEAVGARPIYGMAVPREELNVAVREGAAKAFGDDAVAFGLTVPLPPEQQVAREAHQQAVHCNLLPENLLPGMVAAQRLRDAAFARVAIRALEETGGPVVVITGTGHARVDWGMPAALKVAAPALRVASLGQLEAPPTTAVPYDYWLVADPAPRDDPCEEFATSRGQ